MTCAYLRVAESSYTHTVLEPSQWEFGPFISVAFDVLQLSFIE